MALTVNLTLDNVYSAVASYIRQVTGLTGTQVQRAYQNNIPTPYPYPFAYITVKSPIRNATNEHTYNSTTNNVAISASKILEVQIDFYGQSATDLAQVVQNTFRDELGVSAFGNTGIVPLYADSPFTSGSTDEKGNWMVRTMITLRFNIHPQVTATQDFFNAIDIAVKNAEVL